MVLMISVTGMPGSGKSIVAKRISEKIGWPIYSMGDIVREEVRRRGLELTAENIEYVAKKLREELGLAAVGILLRKKIESQREKLEGVVVDGMRSVYEARELANIGELCIIAVHASPMTRYRRMIERGRRGDIRGWEDFVLRDRYNLSFGIGELIALADFMIVNEGDLEDLYKNVDNIIEVLSNDGYTRCSGGRY
ncbi:MAG: nucleoside monophosphate kinase [Desulfurococcales archaeon]|nr:nucleoside monophosphate kinase [Desulfurococcales archaeon]